MRVERENGRGIIEIEGREGIVKERNRRKGSKGERGMEEIDRK